MDKITEQDFLAIARWAMLGALAKEPSGVNLTLSGGRVYSAKLINFEENQKAAADGYDLLPAEVAGKLILVAYKQV